MPILVKIYEHFSNTSYFTTNKKYLVLCCYNVNIFYLQTIEHLNTNIYLEHLDLSENSISHITDLSFLKHLKVIKTIVYCTGN